MKKRQKNILRIKYLIIVLTLLLPFAQYHLEFAKLEGLKGTFKKEEVKLPVLSLNNLDSGKYQTQADKYWKNELGFRSWLVRLNNQVNYSIFDRTNAQGTIMGEDNVLITEGDIKSFLGKDYIGIDKINEVLDKAKFVSDTLAKRGTSFFIFIAPSKASVYQNEIPSRYFELYKSETTNYDQFIKGIKARKLNVFDTKEIILNDKSYFEHPVYPKNGVHWSGNTVAHVADTLVDYLSQQFNLPMPDIRLQEGETTVKEYRYTDYDIGEAMNLLWNVSHDKLHYPVLTFQNTTKKKPNILGVGDSFIQSFFGFYPVLDTIFSQESNLWYYNRIMGWPLNYSYQSIPILKLDLELELQNRDLVMVEMTEENLKMAGYGFLDDLYDHFKGVNMIKDEMRPLYNKLLNDPELNKEAQFYAPIVGYTIEQMRHALAKNKLKNTWLIDFDYDAEVEKVILAIKGSKDWLASVKEKAIRRNEPLEKTIRDDAVWIVNNKLGKSQ